MTGAFLHTSPARLPPDVSGCRVASATTTKPQRGVEGPNLQTRSPSPSPVQTHLTHAYTCAPAHTHTRTRALAPPQNNHGPLLQRVGGPDVVKKVVELFYKKLYADPRLILFLHDQDVMHLRAKQSAFISWLFGPPNVPYLGRSVRIAHLRIIKQRGFSGDDFDLGMQYFEQAMSELGAPEGIMGEVMRRLRPFKDAFFTPSAKDAEEEGRWVVEEREAAAAEAEAEAAAAAAQEEELRLRERQLQQQMTLAQRAAEAELAAEAEGEGEGEWSADAAVMAAVAASLGASRAATRLPSRGSSAPQQCPFTGGRLSRPGTISASGAAASPPPRTPPTPTPAAAAAAATGPPSTAAASGAASRA
ncbi:hypothetical protein PLESTB_000312300 [Pleodorina starrii]|uniref:Globin n=1 Tax=Pleodorina starrii TaxID=330485 RepID=A0A9W6BE18_9CHLO|nr:hypothetical protein PLESTB_000312300 [Pleodorina starrii]